MPVGRETPVSFSKNTGYLRFIIFCQQSDGLKTVGVKPPYMVTATVSSQDVNHQEREGSLPSDSRFVRHCVFFLLLTALQNPSPKRVFLKRNHVRGCVTKLMDRLSPDQLVNPRSPACSSPFTITPCAFCHLAVFCLQSYSAHLSDTIYGAQFVACRGNRGFWRNLFSHLLHIRYGCFR